MVTVNMLLWALRERGHHERVFVEDGMLGLHTEEGDARFVGAAEYGNWWVLDDKPYRAARLA